MLQVDGYDEFEGLHERRARRRRRHRRAHESLGNLTPADVYFGSGRSILRERDRIKRRTIQQRRLLHRSKAA